MKINISVRGNLRQDDISLLESEANLFSSTTEELVFHQVSKQIDSGFIELTSNVLVSTAAFLFICRELIKGLKAKSNNQDSVTKEDRLEDIDLIKLHSLINGHFNLEELRMLCFHLHVDCDDLPGEGKTAKPVFDTSMRNSDPGPRGSCGWPAPAAGGF